MIISIVNKTIGLLRKLHKTLRRSHQLTTNSLAKSHLDYGDIIYNQDYNASFRQKLGRMQYYACLPITRAVAGTS